MTLLKTTFIALLRVPAANPTGLQLMTRGLHMPCKTTSNKAATWTNSVLAKSEKQISENLKLISVDTQPSQFHDRRTEHKPLVVILEWLLAKSKHIHKFSDIYLNHGFDVLSVKLKPWQLIWPVKGSQLVAGELLNTLYQHHVERPIVIHGFSVGGYLWGEVQVKMSADIDRYQPLVNNIAGAIWDSAVDINETAVGVPAAVFPKNAMLQNACKKYILYHMKTFEKEATQHWRRSRDFFFRPVVQCPSLLLYSKTDPIGNPNSYKNVRTSYESLGIEIYEKCWDKSPHVAHYQFHREEYIAHVESFLEKLGLVLSAEAKRVAAV